MEPEKKPLEKEMLFGNWFIWDFQNYIADYIKVWEDYFWGGSKQGLEKKTSSPSLFEVFWKERAQAKYGE